MSWTPFLLLALAALLDVGANILLKRSDGFRHKLPAWSGIALILLGGAWAAASRAIDQLMDKLDRQVCRHKDKLQDHHHVAAKRLDESPN